MTPEQLDQLAGEWNRVLADPGKTLRHAIEWSCGPALSLNGTKAKTVRTLGSALARVIEAEDKVKR